MTAKEAYRLADSIVRYDARQGWTTSFDFDSERDTVVEMAIIPDRFIGAAYRRHASYWDWNVKSGQREPGRIMAMYNDKLYDAKMLEKGWDVERPGGYVKMRLKRIQPRQIERMT